MQKTNTSKWIGDAVMLVIFLLAFFLDLTGVGLHQWLGAAAAALAGWHLITRWGWVSAVTQRFFGKTSNQARLYLLIDALLLSGLGLITLTGLVISTWLSLSLGYSAVWLAAHILVSIGTLALLVVKLALHGRWIAATTRKIFAPLPEPAAAPAAAAAGVRDRQAMSRRDFLKVMGLVGGASLVALASAGSGLMNLVTAAGEASGSASVDLAGAASASSSASTSQSTDGAPASSQSSGSAASSSSSAPGSGSASASPSSDGAASSSSLTCQGRCPKNKHCAFPGDCRRYTDSSGNGRCDLGECA